MYNLFLEFDNDGNVENVYSIEVFLSRSLSLLLQNVIRTELRETTPVHLLPMVVKWDAGHFA